MGPCKVIFFAEETNDSTAMALDRFFNCHCQDVISTRKQRFWRFKLADNWYEATYKNIESFDMEDAISGATAKVALCADTNRTRDALASLGQLVSEELQTMGSKWFE